jgi:DNA-binding NtrC family response regulator
VQTEWIIVGADPALEERVVSTLTAAGWRLTRDADGRHRVVGAPPPGTARALHQRLQQMHRIGSLLGDSGAMRELFSLIERVAEVDSAVLIAGESGTGKELVARALHDRSLRHDRPFVALNCAALPEPLLESELFGYVRGAFTDARTDRRGLLLEAADGTVFLDEIGDMPLGIQAKLLRVLQDRRVRPVGGNREVAVSARVIAATHRDLDAEAEAGRFRTDLLYRLDVIRLELPPLRDRGADVLLLAQHFLSHSAERLGRPVRGLSDAAVRQLAGYPWPGNVRELQNCMERAVVLAQGPLLEVADLSPKVRRWALPGTISAEGQPDPRMLPTLADVERQHIERTLAACDGSRTHAATVLGIDRKTLYRKLERFRPLPS